MKKRGRGFEVANRIGYSETKRAASKQSRTPAKIRRGAVRAGKVAGAIVAANGAVFAYKAATMIRNDPQMKNNIRLFMNMVKTAIDIDREFARAKRAHSAYTI